jgi:hypothetical protein
MSAVEFKRLTGTDRLRRFILIGRFDLEFVQLSGGVDELSRKKTRKKERGFSVVA